MTPILNIKPGVVWEPCPEMEQAQIVMKDAYADHGQICTVTSCHDGNHSKGSAHKQDIPEAKSQAFDLRIFNLGREIPIQKGQVAMTAKPWWEFIAKFADGLVAKLNAFAVEKKLNGFFVVVIEKDHFHVEWAYKGALPNLVGYAKTQSVYPTKDVRAFLA